MLNTINNKVIKPLLKWLSGDLLDQAYKSTEQLVAPSLAVARKYVATISSGGWSDLQRRPVLNIWRQLELLLRS